MKDSGSNLDFSRSADEETKVHDKTEAVADTDEVGERDVFRSS